MKIISPTTEVTLWTYLTRFELVVFRVEEELHIRQHTSLYGTIQDVFGCEVCQGLKEVDFSKGKLRLSGFLSSTHSYTPSKVFTVLSHVQGVYNSQFEVSTGLLVPWVWY